MYDSLNEFLERHQAEYTMHEHPPIRTAQDAMAIWPEVIPNLVKTIGFRLKDGRIVLVAARPMDRIAYPKLANALGVSRRTLYSLSPDEVGTYLNTIPGGVMPLPLADAISDIWFDRKIEEIEQVYCGTGRLDRTLEINREVLIQLANGRVDDLVK